jgi:hypothetical protein
MGVRLIRGFFQCVVGDQPIAQPDEFGIRAGRR